MLPKSLYFYSDQAIITCFSIQSTDLPSWLAVCGALHAMWVFHPQVLKPDTKANVKNEIVKIFFAMTPKDLYFNEIVFQ